MANEIEIRLQVSDILALNRMLIRCGATIIGEGEVSTISFDFPDRRLRAARRTVRLRQDWIGTTLTAKIPLTEEVDEDLGTPKIRDEMNAPLQPDALETMRRIMLSIGLEESLVYVKRRTSWALWSARVDIDILQDGGGCYVEIEGLEDEITTIRRALKLDAAPIETRSYFSIVHQARSGVDSSGPG